MSSKSLEGWSEGFCEGLKSKDLNGPEKKKGNCPQGGAGSVLKAIRGNVKADEAWNRKRGGRGR